MFNVWSIFGSIGLDPSEAKRGLQESEDAARKAAGTMEKEVKRATTSIEKRLANVGAAMTKLGSQLSLKVTAPIVAFGVATLKAAGDFEASMNRVGAITQATGEEFASLEALAKNLGATTAYSASQAADAMGYLAMAGFDTNEILAALPGTLQLASAGQMDLARAADIASNVLTGFGLKASDIGRVNDVLAATAMSANTNIEQMGEGMKFVAPVAAGLGVSVEEASAAVGLLSNAGIQASSAGTGLRQVLSTLVLQTDKVGVAVRDASGNMRPLADILEDLERKSFSADQALEIFGMRGGPALTALLSQGSGALRELTGELENAGGTAARIAEAQMQGLSGALKNLRSAAEAVSLAIASSGLLEFATDMTNRVTGLLRKLAETNPVALRTGVVIAGIAAAIGPLLLALGGMTKLMGVAVIGAKALTAALSPVAVPLLVIIGALALLKVAWERDWFGIQDFTRGAVAYITEKIGLIVRAGQSVLENWDTVAFTWGIVLERMGYIASDAGEAVSAAWEVSTLAVQRAFTVMFKFVEQGLNVMAGGVIDGVNAIIRGINSTLGTEIAEITSVTLTAWADIDAATAASLDAAQARVAAAQRSMGIEARQIQAAVADAVDIIRRGMERTEEGVAAISVAAEAAGIDVEALLNMITEDAEGAITTLTGVADAVAAIGSIAHLQTRISAAWTAYENAADLASQQAALTLHTNLVAELEAMQERIAGMNIVVPVTVTVGSRTTDQNIVEWMKQAQQSRIDSVALVTAAEEAALRQQIERTRQWQQSRLDAEALVLAAEEAALRQRIKWTQWWQQSRLDGEALLADSERARAAEAERALERIIERQRFYQQSRVDGEALVAAAAEAALRQRIEWTEQWQRSRLDGEALAADAEAAALQERIERQKLYQQSRLDGEALVAAAEAETHRKRIAWHEEFQQSMLAAPDLVRQQREQERAGRVERYRQASETQSTQAAVNRQLGFQAFMDADQARARAAEEAAEAERERLTLLREEIDRRAELIAGLTTMSASKGPLGNFGASLLNLAVERIPLLAGAIQGFVQAGPIGALVGALTDLLGSSTAFGKIMDTLNGILDPFVQAFDMLFTALSPIIDVAVALVDVAFKPFLWLMQNVVAPILTGVANVIKGVWNALAAVIPGMKKIEDKDAEFGDRSLLGELDAQQEYWTERRQEARTVKDLQYAQRRLDMIAEERNRLLDLEYNPAETVSRQHPEEEAEKEDATGLLNDLLERQRQLQQDLLTAETETRIKELNMQLETVAAEIDRLRKLRYREEPAAREPAEPRRDMFFGSAPQSTQFAVATPLVEASAVMLDAAQMMRDAFAAASPRSIFGNLESLPPFTSALERMTPVLERMLSEGVAIRVNGSSAVSAAHLRGV